MSQGKYIKIRTHSIHPSRYPTFDLYLSINGKYVLYLRAGDQLSPDKLAKLKSQSLDVFWIDEKDRAVYKKYVHSQVNDSGLASMDKALILRESSYSLVEELYENPDVNTALDESKEVVANFIGFMAQEPDAFANLIALSSHDFYTYNHSLDVAVYALGLGQVAGFGKEKDLEELGRGALFHDIGKRHVDPAIICKKGPLDEAEWAQMKKHPLFGLQILNDYPGSSEGLKAACFEHHESFQGNGYPQQLQGDEIHAFGRIVAITDTYDALTTVRSYNVPMPPSDAVVFMKEKLAGRFDPELLRAMYEVLFKMKKAG